MTNQILTKNVVLHYDNKTLPPLTLQEADNHLLRLVEKLDSTQTVDINIEIEFVDGLKITEDIVVREMDKIIDNIIRYHVIGKIRYKAGLLTYIATDPDKYLKELENIDTELYKRIYENYSLFYSGKKSSSKTKDLTGILKYKDKYIKLKNKELRKIENIGYNVQLYEGILAGIDRKPEDTEFISKVIAELNTLTPDKNRYHYLKGILEGIELAKIELAKTC